MEHVEQIFFLEGLPPDFKATKTHLDSREVFGKSLLRRVAPTAWSTNYGLAGKEVSTIRLVDLLWRGWQNFHIRALLRGQYLSVVVARKVSESVFASSLLSQLRDRKWELDELASEYCRRNPDAVAKQQNLSADEFKAAKVQARAKHMLENVRDLHVAPLDSEEMQTMQSQAQVIADLKAQLQQERAKKPCPVGPSSSMEPPSKQVRLSGKTSLPRLCKRARAVS